MDEKELKELKKENAWLKSSNKLSSFLFTFILTVMAFCSLCVIQLFAIVGANEVLSNIPENSLSTGFVTLLVTGGWWIVLLVIALFFIGDILKIFREEFTEFFAKLNKIKLVYEKDDETL